jgi:hypothetical protein
MESLKRANPLKDGDAKLPVYGISSYDSGVAKHELCYVGSRRAGSPLTRRFCSEFIVIDLRPAPERGLQILAASLPV